MPNFPNSFFDLKYGNRVHLWIALCTRNYNQKFFSWIYGMRTCPSAAWGGDQNGQHGLQLPEEQELPQLGMLRLTYLTVLHLSKDRLVWPTFKTFLLRYKFGWFFGSKKTLNATWVSFLHVLLLLYRYYQGAYKGIYIKFIYLFIFLSTASPNDLKTRKGTASLRKATIKM